MRGESMIEKRPKGWLERAILPEAKDELVAGEVG